ncbi:histone lysine methyltransferase Set5 [Schizosaccharomyces pombe]|uniref:Histone-lysine N-methyltransferase set5 n=1 Tax=Schizosaccharomyces pombe (strain 972 / ATCC 24843) TaxID=284812 RepID=SET5_SCHPO|nr:putative histone lysine methyltransferase Set5 [Schizosaccharomyces pombe]O74467.1 RecName: Full=SET domain-containing protein 5 [Schizosaccharomyces pombe 972h-]CAA20779.1 histone lysine methyltransferase Set5 (predicted) [Schizosaccharomyces pombe]|eukprot:NP_588413.1 putative histone lysine methyltransferase Set5 [Schizosaccharomyces pombe]
MNPYETEIYKVVPIPNKGMGMIAKVKIPVGTRIFAETPLIRTKSDAKEIEEALSTKTKEEQEAFHRLFNAHPDTMGPFLGPFYSNALTIDETKGGMFLLGSRMNHDCSPNVKHTWNPRLDQVTVHAVRDIEAGEEILTTYIDLHKSHTERQKILLEHFGFKCYCSVCSVEERKIRKISDLRRKQLAYYDRTMAKMCIVNPRGALRALRHRIHIAHEELLFGRLDIIALLDAFRLCVIHGDFERASIFAKKGTKAISLYEGTDSEKYLKISKYVENPRSHALAEGVPALPLFLEEDDELSDLEDNLWGCKLEEDVYSDTD